MWRSPCLCPGLLKILADDWDQPILTPRLKYHWIILFNHQDSFGEYKLPEFWNNLGPYRFVLYQDIWGPLFTPVGHLLGVANQIKQICRNSKLSLTNQFITIVLFKLAIKLYSNVWQNKCVVICCIGIFCLLISLYGFCLFSVCLGIQTLTRSLNSTRLIIFERDAQTDIYKQLVLNIFFSLNVFFLLYFLLNF